MEQNSGVVAGSKNYLTHFVFQFLVLLSVAVWAFYEILQNKYFLYLLSKIFIFSWIVVLFFSLAVLGHGPKDS